MKPSKTFNSLVLARLVLGVVAVAEGPNQELINQVPVEGNLLAKGTINENNVDTAANPGNEGHDGRVHHLVDKVASKAKSGLGSLKIIVSSSNNESEASSPQDKFEREPANPACTKPDYRAHHQGDILKLTNECAHISGNIIISDFQESVLDFGQLMSIGGDLKIRNVSNLVRINAPNLAHIGKRFHLSELTSLTSINFPFLKSVETIEWRILPILSTIGFDAGLDKINSILISDTSLVGFSLKEKIKSLQSLNLNNNRFLESISSDVETIADGLTIAANARNTMASFPALESVSNLTIRDVTSLDLQSIKEVSGSANFYENYFQQLKVPKLKTVGGTLSIIENLNLKDVGFPNVSEIGGGLMISNNSNIDKINFFPKLKVIGGAIHFVGNFKEAVFSKLQLVKGSALIKSASSALDCSKWTDTNNLIIRGGSIVCSAGDKKEELNYDADNVKGTLTRSGTSNSNEGDEKAKQINKATSLASRFELELSIMFVAILLPVFNLMI